MIFITLMKINRTIISKISSLFPILSTCECTCPQKSVRSYREKALEKPLKPLKSGMEQMKGENGIANMLKKVLKTVKVSSKLVLTALKPLRQCKSGRNIALTSANQITEEKKGWITKRENAKSAIKSSCAIDTPKGNAVVRVVEQCLDMEKEVYDLTVKDDHCYYANNILVSNSNYADAFRYACQAVTKLETVSNMGGALEKHKRAVAMRPLNI